jgi:glucose-6-phosphate-specific signal transduction histidine kinase
MPRPQRKEIKYTKESMLALMQEIYNEIVEQRNTAVRIQNKMLTMMKEPEDMKQIGPVIEKQQRIINDCVEKKLTLSKLQSQIWEKSNSTQESFSLSDMDEDLINQLIEKDSDVDDEEPTYRMR